VVRNLPPLHTQHVVLAYTILPGGLDLGLELVKRGDATARADRPPFKSLVTYIRAQEDAQATSVGLWACPTGSAPAGTASPRPAPTKPAPPGMGADEAQDHGHGQSDQGGQPGQGGQRGQSGQPGQSQHG
jgi:hypothetical protein